MTGTSSSPLVRGSHGLSSKPLRKEVESSVLWGQGHSPSDRDALESLPSLPAPIHGTVQARKPGPQRD